MSLSLMELCASYGFVNSASPNLASVALDPWMTNASEQAKSASQFSVFSSSGEATSCKNPPLPRNFSYTAFCGLKSTAAMKVSYWDWSIFESLASAVEEPF